MEIWFRAADKDAIAGAREEEGLAQITALALQLLGLAGGAWLVTRTLRPIRNFSSAAQKIATGDLGQRINTPDSESELGQLAGVLNSTFACLDAGQEPLRRDECHLYQLTADSIDLIRPLAATRGIHIQTDLPATLCHGDADRLAHLKNVIEGFLKYLLFTEEAPLSTPIQGSVAFVQQFEAQESKDTKGRSLRQFDLETRLFKYPCSYLIYSEAFDALPRQLKDPLYQRLWDILTGKDTSPTFKRILVETRQAIREILIETKKGLPSYWKQKS